MLKTKRHYNICFNNDINSFKKNICRRHFEEGLESWSEIDKKI